ncbi:MAG: response regulator [Acidobacteriota bacterium]|nr:response regulator [Acidobacteriota bacterium]
MHGSLAMGEIVPREQPCILVVDDDPGIRRLIVSTLRRDGYTLTEAQNGQEALDAMRQGNEDLVLLDLMMPHVSGWDVLRIRKTAPELRRIPVIVITAAGGPEMAEVVAGGVFAVLPKPFDLPALHAIVKSCLAHEHGDDQPDSTRIG